MNLSDELKKMRNRGKQVVSIDFVLESLREAQGDNCKFCEQLPESKFRTWRKPLQNVRGGDSNKPISEINRRSS